MYIACGYTDLRRGIDRLASLVEQQFHLDPFTNEPDKYREMVTISRAEYEKLQLRASMSLSLKAVWMCSWKPCGWPDISSLVHLLRRAKCDETMTEIGKEVVREDTIRALQPWNAPAECKTK